ncbi:pyrethroid hydrolase Ces2a-like isoform X2 [Scylla paramamosain]|uniref:pyrethroid hydrolase Ces2a-like isoform X2 n=1 Tax=Scylla paramamosain TaxID=85552 RepID=UPI003083080D
MCAMNIKRFKLVTPDCKMESNDSSRVLSLNEVVKPSEKNERPTTYRFLTINVVAILLVILAAFVSIAVTASESLHDDLEQERGGPLVHTAKGTLRGIQERSLGGHSFFSFYAIPYAKPPLGKLRFQDPVEEEAWTGVRNAFSYPEPCIQISFSKHKVGDVSEENMIGSEDCLYLNVFTPKLDAEEKLPVMVYLHGGGYISGTAYQYQPYVLLNHQVVLVVPQFRLGMLAFLSTEDDVMSGNYMLKDQLAALQWVHRNIHLFGGDPHRLTLFGESAGGCSTGLLSISPKAQGLFSRVIQQSGNAMVPFAFGRRHRKVAKDTARILGYHGKPDSKDILSFLQTVPAQSLPAIASKYYEWFIYPFVTGPRVDGDVIPAHPYEMAQAMACPPWELMIGHTADDGALLTINVYLLEKLRRRLEDDFTEVGPLSLVLADNDPNKEIKAEALYHYYLGESINLELKDNFTQLHTDYNFAVPNDLVALAHSTCAKPHRHTFFYELTHRGQRSVNDPLNITVGKHWVTHADDILYLFLGETFRPGLLPLERPEDLALRDIMSKLWVNFAYTGNPTPDGSLGFTWEAVENDNLHYLSLTPSPTMKPDPRRKIREFYRKVLPEQNEFLEKLADLKHP